MQALFLKPFQGSGLVAFGGRADVLVFRQRHVDGPEDDQDHHRKDHDRFDRSRPPPAVRSCP